MNVVFDLDGTLADVEHRIHHIRREDGEKRDWTAFEDECPRDKPIWQTIKVFRDISSGTKNDLQIWTGRSERVREETERWLVDHVGFQYNFCGLIMRPENDFTEDHVLKERWLDAAIKDGWHPQLAFDDRKRVCDMWRHRGVVCYHVTDGFF